MENLISTLRDCKLIEIKLVFRNDNRSIELKLTKSSDDINLVLHNVKHTYIFDDTIQPEYIGQLKGLKKEEKDYWLSLDPYDERIDKIEERDNYVFNFEKFEFK